MSTQIIDGKAVAAQVTAGVKARVEALKAKGITVGLAVILAGEDPASQVYVRNKIKKCAELGIDSRRIDLPADVTMETMLATIDELNHDPAIHGILVQFPPPKQLDQEQIIDAISPDKDVDCFCDRNVGRILEGRIDGFLPCTPAGVMELLKAAGIDPSGKHAVVVGRSNIVGKPLAALLMQKNKGANATVTVVHSGTPDLGRFTRDADILIAAIGKPCFITGDMIKPGAAVIDVGINRITGSDGKSKLAGDVDFDSAVEVAGAITPVPGGVGPMTIAMLMDNAVRAAEKASANA
ncbi:MAG: bifunctional 5,10-methylenetetrahydrofolate dehydrogenase/5,10-methenyltetrahydrofolate cyclohydrolase [Lentisphaeria bacterium]|nr:bifunctional 5,10-methylenetetrahydrofolate dehydrogenase/5,10-methenyltetrahydrofolate cyclohydrolase [Lentisphaeria bacterium]